jgi:hypothetical protein
MIQNTPDPERTKKDVELLDHDYFVNADTEYQRHEIAAWKRLREIIIAGQPSPGGEKPQELREKVAKAGREEHFRDSYREDMYDWEGLPEQYRARWLNFADHILSLFQGQPAGGRPMPLKAKFTRYSRYPEYGVLEFLYDGAKASDLPGLASDIGEEIVIRINQGNQ